MMQVRRRISLLHSMTECMEGFLFGGSWKCVLTCLNRPILENWSFIHIPRIPDACASRSHEVCYSIFAHYL